MRDLRVHHGHGAQAEVAIDHLHVFRTGVHDFRTHRVRQERAQRCEVLSRLGVNQPHAVRAAKLVQRGNRIEGARTHELGIDADDIAARTEVPTRVMVRLDEGVGHGVRSASRWRAGR